MWKNYDIIRLWRFLLRSCCCGWYVSQVPNIVEICCHFDSCTLNPTTHTHILTLRHLLDQIYTIHIAHNCVLYMNNTEEHNATDSQPTYAPYTHANSNTFEMNLFSRRFRTAPLWIRIHNRWVCEIRSVVFILFYLCGDERDASDAIAILLLYFYIYTTCMYIIY